MHTRDELIVTGRRRRRRHSELFKAEAVGACQQPGISIAAVALARGLNAALLRRWVKQAERSGVPIAIRPTMPGALEGSEGFVPVALAQSTSDGVIRIEVQSKRRRVSVQWPASAAHECALFLRELVK